VIVGLLLFVSDRATAQAPSDDITRVATARPLSEILRDELAGLKATGPIEEYRQDRLAELVGKRAPVYREYGVRAAGSRPYGPIRVDLFKTETVFGAFGLLSYFAGSAGVDTVRLPREILIRRSDLLIRVAAQVGGAAFDQSRARKTAAAIVEQLGPESAGKATPTVLASLPRDLRTPSTERYLLGPESLRELIGPSAGVFEFHGAAEAVLAEYRRAADDPAPMRLLIVEYHTPQLAFDAIERVNAHIASLPADQQGSVIGRRVGNYIVQVSNIEDPGLAGQLVESVKYPYGVKWLQNPDVPSGDPFYAQKTAQVLISSFGIIGLVMVVVAIGGTIFGTLVFMKRRKRLRAIFSDAGGMMRLDIDPAPGTSLGPARQANLLGGGED
jgi:hypothetical protein